jgi:molybdopterin molybdotransferase
MSLGHSLNAIQVFTGSRLPEDTDAVVMIEDTARDGGVLTFSKSLSKGENLRLKGEELQKGDSLLSQGLTVTPAVLALLASSGQSVCSVYRRPRVTVIETGNELRSFGENLEEGEIYAANGLALSAAARQLGAEVISKRCNDDPSSMKELFSEAARDSDFVITSGGVSVGKHDHVREIWRQLGIDERFWKVAIRPGRPLFFAAAPGGLRVFGLPGNPVSSLTTFHLFVRPALLKFQGKSDTGWSRGRTSYTLESSETVEVFERVHLQDGILYPIKQQGSHMTSGIAGANALARIPRGVGTVPVGSSLAVSLLTWSY